MMTCVRTNIAHEGAVRSRAAWVGQDAEKERGRKKAECFIQSKAERCSRMELLWISNSDEYTLQRQKDAYEYEVKRFAETRRQSHLWKH